jgi:PAS domain S-box-containing protein
VLRQMTELKLRLTEAEDTLDAIRSGSIDALVVRTPKGEQLFTLKGADQTYRALVEAMNQGAVTLNQNTVAYCNSHFARMVRAPLERVIGSSIFSLVETELRQLLEQIQRRTRRRGAVETVLLAADGARIPVLLAASRFPAEGQESVCLVVTDITERKEAERARLELSRRILNAQEAERQRVARDLHDSINQLLASARYRLSQANSRSRAGLTGKIREARELLEQAIAEVRLISRNLRPSELDDLGLHAALRTLTQEFHQRTGIAARFRPLSTGPLPAEVEMAFYRIAQEALNNIEKHSRATRAELALVFADGQATLSIRDNGRGLTLTPRKQSKTGWGLRNMRERASILGGSLTLVPLRGKGTRLSVSIPVHDPSRNGNSV